MLQLFKVTATQQQGEDLKNKIVDNDKADIGDKVLAHVKYVRI